MVVLYNADGHFSVIFMFVATTTAAATTTALPTSKFTFAVSSVTYAAIT